MEQQELEQLRNGCEAGGHDVKCTESQHSRRLRWVDLWTFLVYIMNFRTARAKWRDLSQKTNNQKEISSSLICHG